MAKIKRRHELMAGIFVVLALAAIFVMLILISDFGSMFRSMRRYTVTFTVCQSVEGLSGGAPVKLGGYKIGNVIHVRPQRAAESRPKDDPPEASAAAEGQSACPRPWRMVVTFQIPEEYELATDARVELVRPLLGTDAVLNITDVGAERKATEADQIVGRIASAPFLSDAVEQLGFGDDERLAVQKIVALVHSLAESLAAGGQSIEDLLRDGGEVYQLVTNARKASEQLGPILDNVEQASVSVRSMLGAQGVVQRIAGRVDKAAEIAVAILEENRDDIKKTMTHIAKATEGARATQEKIARALDPMLQKVDTGLTNANQALANFRDLAAQANQMIARNRVPIDAMVDDMRATAGNLVATTAEVRANPWRLLYQPTEKDKQRAELHDAARSFAVGAGEVNNAVRKLAAVTASSGGRPLAESPEVRRALEELRISLANFRKVEHFLMAETIKRQ
jgi:ABC-type transporter Mla subunit MlaD